MFFSDAPEMTTAVTAGILAAFAFMLAFRLGKPGSDGRTRLWQFVLTGIGAVSVLGVPAHAIRSIAGTAPADLNGQTAYWTFLGLFLFAMTTLLGIAVLSDAFPKIRARTLGTVMASTGTVFYAIYAFSAITGLLAGYFIVFIAYSAIVMIFALVTYSRLAMGDSNPGFRYLASATAVAIAGSILQASRSVSFRVIWEFDYNSVYHFFMMAATALFYRGIKGKRIIAS